jgi:hypothetical protein
MEAGLREDRPHVATELRRRGFDPFVSTDVDTESDGKRHGDQPSESRSRHMATATRT